MLSSEYEQQPLGLGAVVAGKWGKLGGGPRLTVVVLYIIASRIWRLEFAKLGFSVGPLPIFATEVTLGILILLSVTREPGRLIFWTLFGHGAGPVGKCCWLIFWLSVLHLMVSFPDNGLLAFKDFMIFSYVLFFPITLWAIDTRGKAVVLLYSMIYSGVLLAALLLVFALTGVNLVAFEANSLVTSFGFANTRLGGGDVGGILVATVAGLYIMVVLSETRRPLHLAAIVIVLIALGLNQTRAAFAGLMACALYSMFALPPSRLGRVLVPTSLAVLIAGIVFSLSDTPVPAFVSALGSGLSGALDDNVKFRLERWHYVIGLWFERPLAGFGFGHPLAADWLIGVDAKGGFNRGMPHNTWLTIGARTGLVGLTLFLISVVVVLANCIWASGKGDANAERTTAGAMFVTLAGFATFVLFFERPIHAVSFWVLAAIVWRLRITESESFAESPSPAFG